MENPPSNTSLESPLLSLLDVAMHEMTEEQLRAHVAKLHEARVSSQSFQASVRIKVPASEAKTTDLFSQFE